MVPFHYQVMQFKDYVALVEYYPQGIDGTPMWTEAILVAEDVEDLLDDMDQMMRDIADYGVIPNPQS